MPSDFSREEVRRLARLARVALRDDELDLFARQLGEILLFVRQVESVDTTASVQPVAPPRSPLRPDTIEPSLDRDTVLTAAPDADTVAGLFTVPRVPGE
jgi:aspartyl-tRNA(Asn)/glutamyl-tRNA(Gln) amidotransferase subunit C